MFHPLPSETVFEAQKRSRQATAFFFAILFGTYIVVFLLIGLFALFVLGGTHLTRQVLENSLLHFTAVIMGISLVIAAIQFHSAFNITLEQILEQLGARPFDTHDDYHQTLGNIVSEAELACGIRPIRAVVLASGGCNAFSIADGKGDKAIGVTEGLLARLTRPELSAVIAHEAAHLANGDSRLSTIAGCITDSLDFLSRHSIRLGSRSDKAARIIFLQAIVWILAKIGAFLSHILHMAISRKREYLADSHAVQMCKDPVSMFRALQKIARQYRGSIDFPKQFAPVFILNPSITALDENSGLFSDLFSTHPPLQKRLLKLQQWAKTDVSSFKEEISNQNPSPVPEPEPELKFLFHLNNEWKGPYTPSQILALKEIQPSTLTSPMDSNQMVQAGDIPLLFSIFENRLLGTVRKERCPHCHTSLIAAQYEEAPVMQCSFCHGYLLLSGVLERIIARRERIFSKEQIDQTKHWADLQKIASKELSTLPKIDCPSCQSAMVRCFHSMMTHVVMDRCVKPYCQSIWLDPGELEIIQIMVEQSTHR